MDIASLCLDTSLLIDYLKGCDPGTSATDQYFKPGDKHGFWSQFNAFSAAEILQHLLDKTKRGT